MIKIKETNYPIATIQVDIDNYDGCTECLRKHVKNIDDCILDVEIVNNCGHRYMLIRYNGRELALFRIGLEVGKTLERLNNV